MAITDWKEAAANATLVASRLGRREWTAPYILTSDNPRDDGQVCVDFMDTIGCGLSMPFRYADREDYGSFCKQITPVRMANSTTQWLVTCSYSPWEGDGQDEDKETLAGDPAESPLDWRWDISTADASFQVPVEKAWNEDEFPPPDDGLSGGYIRPKGRIGPVHNSAGIVYDPPLMRDITELVVRVTGNLQEWDSSVALAFRNHINNTPIKWSSTLTTYYGFRAAAFAQHCVLCSGHTATYRRSNDISYWSQTWEFRLRTPADDINPQDGFLETVLDQGYTRLAGIGDPDGRGGTFTSGDLKDGMGIGAAIRDMDGERTHERVCLNGHGQPLQSSSTWTQPPVYFRWRIHPTAYFPGVPLDIFDAA